jgi:uncharacterized protein YkwD
MRDPQRLPVRLILAGLVLEALWLNPTPAQGRKPSAANGQAVALPSTSEMERDLLAAINRERATRNLPPLRLSDDIARVARFHSTEMAEGGILSHLSAAGKTFTERLVEASIAFAANGENVARSETFVADLIHRSFMESPGHRENILNPEFDEVGIGIVRGAGKAYFVTEDFIRGLAPRSGSEVRIGILAGLNGTRKARGLAPLVTLDELDRMAGIYAQDKAAGRKVPGVPAFYGETFVRFAVSPDLDMIAASIGGFDMSRCDRAGIGVAFGRSPEYPGGAYSVCALLVARDSPPGFGELARVLKVLAAANAIRANKRLTPLVLDDDLVEQAGEVLAARRSRRDGRPLVQAEGNVFFFMFQKLDVIAAPLRKRLEDIGLRRIGISTLPIESSNRDTPLGYAVAVILAR